MKAKSGVVMNGGIPREFDPAVGNERESLGSVLARHERELLALANVIGVADGAAPDGGPVIVVYVRTKVPADQLAPADLLPTSLDGIPVDVVAVGDVQALEKNNH